MPNVKRVFHSHSPKPRCALPASRITKTPATVEFLVDAESGEWYFIEVNPRVQVEHTVTEVVTGIDIVRSQIQIAQGHHVHRAPMSLRKQDGIVTNGYALQCRVTTRSATWMRSPTWPFVPRAIRWIR